MYYLGCDPDLRNCSFGIIDEYSRPVWVWCCKVHRKERDPINTMIRHLEDGMRQVQPQGVIKACVESQAITYTGKKNKARPQDILNLAYVSGAVAGILRAHWSVPTVTLVKPQTWKGSIPKHIKQKRIWKDLGIPCELKGGDKPYTVPKIKIAGSDALNMSDWADATDAFGLALYAKRQLK